MINKKILTDKEKKELENLKKQLDEAILNAIRQNKNPLLAGSDIAKEMQKIQRKGSLERHHDGRLQVLRKRNIIRYEKKQWHIV